jgi:hypothetical protein
MQVDTSKSKHTYSREIGHKKKAPMLHSIVFSVKFHFTLL